MSSNIQPPKTVFLICFLTEERWLYATVLSLMVNHTGVCWTYIVKLEDP